MITKGKLDIFSNGVLIDRSLPKFKKPVQVSGGVDGFNTVEPLLFNSGRIVSSDDTTLEYMVYLNSVAPTFLTKLKIFLYKLLYNYGKRDNRKPVKNLDKFFDDLKTNVSTIDREKLETIISKYKSILQSASDNNQVALVERIEDYATILKQETILSLSKFTKYLSEEDVVKFHDKASMHDKYKTDLCLTYIKNFVKIIPDDVSLLKREADRLNIFDNYVILHYDYNGSGSGLTKEEIAKKKDPILFGVIQNSNKLYYIGDWIDEYCDLTLDVLINTIGKESVDEIDTTDIQL